MRKIPFAGVELKSQGVRGLRGTSELPGRPESRFILEQGHHRRADDHLSTENYVKFVVLFNIADGFPCFHG